MNNGEWSIPAVSQNFYAQATALILDDLSQVPGESWTNIAPLLYAIAANTGFRSFEGRGQCKKLGIQRTLQTSQPTVSICGVRRRVEPTEYNSIIDSDRE